MKRAWIAVSVVGLAVVLIVPFWVGPRWHEWRLLASFRTGGPVQRVAAATQLIQLGSTEGIYAVVDYLGAETGDGAIGSDASDEVFELAMLFLSHFDPARDALFSLANDPQRIRRRLALDCLWIGLYQEFVDGTEFVSRRKHCREFISAATFHDSAEQSLRLRVARWVCPERAYQDALSFIESEDHDVQWAALCVIEELKIRRESFEQVKLVLRSDYTSNACLAATILLGGGDFSPETKNVIAANIDSDLVMLDVASAIWDLRDNGSSTAKVENWIRDSLGPTVADDIMRVVNEE